MSGLCCNARKRVIVIYCSFRTGKFTKSPPIYCTYSIQIHSHQVGRDHINSAFEAHPFYTDLISSHPSTAALPVSALHPQVAFRCQSRLLSPAVLSSIVPLSAHGALFVRAGYHGLVHICRQMYRCFGGPIGGGRCSWKIFC